MKQRDLRQSGTFTVISPVTTKAEGQAFVWSHDTTGQTAGGMTPIKCAVVAEADRSLIKNLPLLEKVFGKLDTDPRERELAMFEILAFRCLLECARHGDNFGWNNYIEHLVKPRWAGLREEELIPLLKRMSAWNGNFPKGFNLSKMLWDNAQEMGLRFVVWESNGKTGPAIYAPNLKLAIMAYCLAQMESPRGAWALCPICGNDFERSKINALYCSDACGWAARKRRQREKGKNSNGKT